MNDDDFGAAWATLDPTAIQRRRIEARVFDWLEASDTPLAAEWLALFKMAPLPAFGLAAVSAVSMVMATPLLWVARSLW